MFTMTKTGKLESDTVSGTGLKIRTSGLLGDHPQLESTMSSTSNQFINFSMIYFDVARSLFTLFTL